MKKQLKKVSSPLSQLRNKEFKYLSYIKNKLPPEFTDNILLDNIL